MDLFLQIKSNQEFNLQNFEMLKQSFSVWNRVQLRRLGHTASLCCIYKKIFPNRVSQNTEVQGDYLNSKSSLLWYSPSFFPIDPYLRPASNSISWTGGIFSWISHALPLQPRITISFFLTVILSYQLWIFLFISISIRKRQGSSV